MDNPFWEQPDTVEQFAARPPDHRLLQLIEEFARPDLTRVLDLGCAGGRNTVLIAERGFDVWAVDASRPMVERTRARVADSLGDEEARRRIRLSHMDDLSHFSDGFFDLVVALGIYHSAQSMTEWKRAVGETARVMKRQGRLLVNHFTPEVDLTGEGVRPVLGESGVYEGLAGSRGVLMDAEELDTAMADFGFLPVVPSQTVRVETDRGRRVSVNALYRRV